MGAGEPEISLYSLDRESSSRRPWGEAITSTGTRHPDKAAPRLASCRLPQRVTADLGEAALQDCEQQETSEEDQEDQNVGNIWNQMKKCNMRMLKVKKGGI